MADFSIQSVTSQAVHAPEIQIQRVQPRPEVNVPTPVREAPEAEQEPRVNLENVVSTSEDGDTVQVSDQAAEALEDDEFGKVLVKEDELETELNPNQVEVASTQVNFEPVYLDFSAPETEELFEDVEDVVPVTTYAGYSESQLEQMYRDGEISQYRYQKELETREERLGAEQENAEELNEEMAEQMQELRGNEQTANAIAAIYDESTSDLPDIQLRADILSQLQDFPLNIQ